MELMKKTKVLPVNTLIGERSRLVGTLMIDETIKIDGQIEGDIISTSDVIVGETASIMGNIRACNVLISGTVHGDVESSGQLSLSKSAVLNGNVRTKSLIIDDGARFIGMSENVEAELNEDEGAEAAEYLSEIQKDLEM